MRKTIVIILLLSTVVYADDLQVKSDYGITIGSLKYMSDSTIPDATTAFYTSPDLETQKKLLSEMRDFRATLSDLEMYHDWQEKEAVSYALFPDPVCPQQLTAISQSEMNDFIAAAKIDANANYSLYARPGLSLLAVKKLFADPSFRSRITNLKKKADTIYCQLLGQGLNLPADPIKSPAQIPATQGPRVQGT